VDGVLLKSLAGSVSNAHLLQTTSNSKAALSRASLLGKVVSKAYHRQLRAYCLLRRSLVPRRTDAHGVGNPSPYSTGGAPGSSAINLNCRHWQHATNVPPHRYPANGGTHEARFHVTRLAPWSVQTPPSVFTSIGGLIRRSFRHRTYLGALMSGSSTTSTKLGPLRLVVNSVSLRRGDQAFASDAPTEISYGFWKAS